MNPLPEELKMKQQQQLVPMAAVSTNAPAVTPQIPSLDLIKTHPDLIVTGSTSFTWTIPNWSTLKKIPENRITSDLFTIPNDSDMNLNDEESTGIINHKCAWRLLMFPNGNRGSGDFMSVFLECVEIGKDGNPVDHSTIQHENTRIPESHKWHVCAYFHIVLQHPQSNEIFCASNGAHHRFNSKETDWGFSQYCAHAALTKPGEGMTIPCLENDQFSLRVFIKRVQDSTGVLWHNFADWDSKLETGYVGIKNQGATCYLNSLIQSLYYTNYFRKATYEIPTQNDDPSKSVAYALQRLFYYMQFSTDAVGTNELTKSFGWDTMDAFHQHDVQELNRVLQDNLENTMKGTPAEGAIRKLFTGKMKSYIKCVNVDYESSRVEDYYDIQLNVKGCKNLHESFVDYCKVEMLDGENKYFAEGFGLQDAKKGVIFESFPPVLHLQLKRFDYDMERDQFVKINDRHEFPLSMDISEFLSPEADRSVPQNYLLQGVLVHSGDLNAGHYYALLRPKKDGPWFKYDDDKVVPASYKDVLDANFGGEPIARTGIKQRAFYTNAYMLVYIRESDEDEILADVTEDQIPIHLRNRVKKDIEEAYARRMEEQERHLYIQVHVVNDNDLQFHSGFDIGFPYEPKTMTSSSTSPVRVFKAKRDQSLADFLELYANEINVDPSQVRFWNIVPRQNKTLRIELPFPMDKMNSSLNDVVSYQKQASELRIYAQLASSELSRDAFAGSPKVGGPVEKDILIFIKHYDPFNQSMRVALTVSVKRTDPISSILPSLRKVANFSERQPLIIYEEVKPGMVEKIDLADSFDGAELLDGDILCFQQELTGQEMDSLNDPTLATAPGYFEVLQNRIEVHFKHRGAKDGASKDIVLVMNKKMSYEQVVSYLSNEIHHDAAKIKLYSSKVNGTAGLAVSQRHSLHEMTATNPYALQSHSFVLFYELLDISLEELERKMYVKLSYLENGIKENGPHTLLIEKTATLEELASALFKKLEFSESDLTRHHRFVEVSNNRRVKILPPGEVISFIKDYASLYLESFDEEECALLEGKVEGKMVEVFHFSKDIYRSHSTPFTFLLIPGEVFSATKERLARRMNLPKKDFDKIKVAIVPRQAKPAYPEDDDVISLNAEGVAIGLDHIDKGRKSGGVGLRIN